MIEQIFEPVIKHVALDKQGNETEVSVETLPNGLVQDTEYSDTPEGN